MIPVITIGCRPAVVLEETGEDGKDTGVSGVPVRLEAGPTVTCDSPELRETEGPFETILGGPDWAGQATFEGDAELDLGRGLTVVDFDQDGQYDIFLPNLGPDQLFMGEGDGIWRNETDDLFGLRFHRTTGSVAADVDGDGTPDLVTINRGNPNRLYRNNGSGRFDVVDGAGFQDLGLGSIGGSFGDLDLDGDLDLFICAHFNGPTEGWDQENPWPADASELYENLGDGTFLSRSDALPQAAHDGYSYACGLHDLDADGRLDLYFVNDFGSRVVPNRAYRNTTKGSTWNFEDVSEETGLGVEVFGMGLGVGDLNGDTLPDLLITSWDDLALLESAADGTWYESSASRGLSVDVGVSDVGWGAELEDLDNDGDLDALIAYGYLEGDDEVGLLNPVSQKNALFVQGENGLFQEDAAAWGLDDGGVNRGFVLVDLDRNGFLDLVSRDLLGPAKIRMARCNASNWLAVRLDQGGWNGAAIGARIELTTAMGTQVRWIRAGGTNLSSSGPPVVHFGLGEQEQVDKLRIVWPDGAETGILQVGTRQVLRVHRL